MSSISPVSTHRPRRFRRAILATRIPAAAGLAFALGWATPASAATVSNWNLDASGNWSLSTNWSGGIPTAAGDTANLTFNVGGTRTITIDGTNGSRTVGVMTIGDSNNTNSYVVAAAAGNKLIFDNGGSAATATLTAVATSFGDTISAPIVLNSQFTIKNSAAASTLTLSSGGISSGSTGTKTITVDATSAAGTISITGAITTGAGDVAIVKNSSDNLILGGGNNFTGGVTLNAGTLTLNNATALGATGSTLTITGGTLAGNTSLTTTNAESWNGDFALGGSTNLSLTGSITMNASRTITVAGSGTYSFFGSVNAPANSTLNTANASGSATGVLLLFGTNNYTGGTNINGGVVGFGIPSAIPTTGVINVQAGGALSVSGAYTSLAGWLGDSHLSPASAGALALNASSGEDYAPGVKGFNTLSLGATVGNTYTYTGNYTPGTSGYYVGGGGGTLVFSNANAFTGSSNLTVGNGGGGTVVVTGSNDLSGLATITNGTLQIGNGGSNGSLNNASGVVDNANLTFNLAGNTVFNPAISGTGSVTRIGEGNVTLTSSPSYTGATILGNATLTFGADASGSSSLIFGTSAGATKNAALDLSSANATFGSLGTQTNFIVANTIVVGSGKTLTINGAFAVGYNLGSVGASSTATSLLTISGGGSLVVTNAAATVSIGVAQTTPLTTATTNTLDLTGLASVTLGSATTAINTLSVAFGQSAAGTLLLSDTANLITAGTINVGHSNAANGGAGVMTLGKGTNIIHADTFNVGFSKVNGTISFASNTGPGTVVIGNKAGSGGATLNIGSQSGTGTAGVITGTLDLRGHSATVTAGAVNVGNNNNPGGTTPPGSASGVIDFDTGTFAATTLNLGLKSNAGGGTNTGNFVNIDGGTFTVSGATAMSAHSGSGAGDEISTLNLTGGSFTTGTLSVANKSSSGTGAAIGTVNVSGGSFTVSGATFTLATQASAGTASGTLNITGGTVTSNASILDGVGTTTTTITLNGGTLDLKNHSIGGTTTTAIDVLNFQSGTLQNVAQINNGAAGVTKTAGSGTDTLILAGANTYSGATTVSEGTLLVNGSITGSTVNVNAGTLGGSGTINLSAGQSVAVGATLAPGSSSAIGELKVAGGNGVAFSGNSTFSIQTGVAGASDKLTITGATGNLSLATGTDTLALTTPQAGAFTIASWTGTRTGFFDVVTVNGFNETYTVATAGSLTTYTFDSGDGSIVYDDGSGTLTATLSVPEPTSALSLLAGLGLLAGMQRLRRRLNK